MGNEASTAMAIANAKSKMNNTFDQINDSLNKQPKKDLPKTQKEHNQRRKDRQADYKEKQAVRAERKSMIAEKWASHRQENTTAKSKKGFFSSSK